MSVFSPTSTTFPPVLLAILVADRLSANEYPLANISTSSRREVSLTRVIILSPAPLRQGLPLTWSPGSPRLGYLRETVQWAPGGLRVGSHLGAGDGDPL